MVDYSDLIGIPFKSGGRSKKGIDCYGLVKEIYDRMGEYIPDYCVPDYDRYTISNEIHKRVNDWLELKRDNLKVPCVVAMRFNAPAPYVNHVGVYIGDGKFLHARERVGVCVDRIDSPAWRKVIVGFYVYNGGA